MNVKFLVGLNDQQLKSRLGSFNSFFSEDLLRDINDPEHPMSLEELNVIQMENIEVSNLVFLIE